MEFLKDTISKYSEEHTAKEPELLSKLNKETWIKKINPRMLSGHMQGRILSMLSKMINPKNIIEIGTYTGYSALCLAEGIKDNGTIHTIDINEEHISLAKEYFDKSVYKKNIKQYIGDALEVIPKINQRFQLAFIDADKENYLNYFNLIISKIDVGGYIITDNVLWSGKVLNKEKDEETKAIDRYNKEISADKRIDSILLPVRDGLMISRKISN